MYNFTFDPKGVYIGNLANYGEKYGITQYCFAHNYEFVGKEFKITDGEKEHTIAFTCKEKAVLDGAVCDYECLKITLTCYLVRLGFNAAVVDTRQGLITLILGDEYFYGKIEGFDVPADAAHIDGGDDLVETNVAWYLAPERYVWHEYLDKDTVRVKWSPNPSSLMDSPYKVTRIDSPVYLTDVKDYGPFYSDAPKLLERVLLLADYDHMMVVGIVYAGGEIPMMISGIGKFMDIEEDGSMSEIAGGS